MSSAGMPPGFWTELLLLLAVIIVLVGLIPAIIRRKAGADKRKWFSYNHLNKLHKKVDWTLRIVYTILIIISALFFSSHIFLLSIILAFFVISQLGIQAYMEWRFSNNRRNYQVSLLQLGLTVLALSGCFYWVVYVS